MLAVELLLQGLDAAIDAGVLAHVQDSGLDHGFDRLSGNGIDDKVVELRVYLLGKLGLQILNYCELKLLLDCFVFLVDSLIVTIPATNLHLQSRDLVCMGCSFCLEICNISNHTRDMVRGRYGITHLVAEVVKPGAETGDVHPLL